MTNQNTKIYLVGFYLHYASGRKERPMKTCQHNKRNYCKGGVIYQCHRSQWKNNFMVSTVILFQFKSQHRHNYYVSNDYFDEC